MWRCDTPFNRTQTCSHIIEFTKAIQTCCSRPRSWPQPPQFELDHGVAPAANSMGRRAVRPGCRRCPPSLSHRALIEATPAEPTRARAGQWPASGSASQRHRGPNQPAAVQARRAGSKLPSQPSATPSAQTAPLTAWLLRRNSAPSSSVDVPA